MTSNILETAQLTALIWNQRAPIMRVRSTSIAGFMQSWLMRSSVGVISGFTHLQSTRNRSKTTPRIQLTSLNKIKTARKLEYQASLQAAFFGAVSLLAMIGSNSPAIAQQLTPISVISFPSPHDWPIWVAQERGYFDRSGLAVSLTPTSDSKFQLTGLIDGKFDIAMTGIDNVVAYMEGQGEAPTQAAPNIFAFMGASNRGFLRLVTSPEVKNFTDLKGKQLSVDSLTTGYAFVLRKLLENGGLKFSDVEFASVGGLQQRFGALMEKKQAGTLLISPMHVIAQQRGFNILANAEDVLGNYQASVGATRRDWAKDNKAALVGYIRAYMDAIKWLRDPTNEAEAVAILRKNMPNLTKQMAVQVYAVLLDKNNGLDPLAELDIKGIERVLALRSEYGEPRKALTEARKYYDLQYHVEAIGLEK